MDPQKLLFLDKRVVRTIRGAGLFFSALLALVCVLAYVQVITIENLYTWACLPLAGALIVLGLLEAFWNPYTQAKVSLYITLYMIIGAPLSILVLGFSTMIFMGWALLIVVAVIFFGVKRAAIGYGLMIASLFTWLILHAGDHTRGDVLAFGVSALTIGILCLLVLNLWRLTNNSIHGMEEAHVKQDFEHRQLSSLVNSMTDGVIAVDSQIKVMLYNAAALNLLDLNSDMQGKSLRDFLKLSTEQQETVNITKLVRETNIPTVNRDYRITYKDGSFANLFLSIAPVHLGYGNEGKRGFVLILRDITREKSLEEERDEFISVVSHELRTPIAITEGEVSNAQLMADKSGGTPELKKALDEAHNQVLFLADMINDLSTLSRAERGVLKLDAEEINVNDLLKELADNYRQQATDKKLKLTAKPIDKSVILRSGKLYVREVLQNFITNAIKYTQKGSVTISAETTASGIKFTVHDTGIGISKQDQKRVFEKFFRSEDYRTRATNGTGLGLYVTLKLVNLLGAKVDVQSELNKGSTFSVTVPNLAPENKDK